jgi:hypothetical protein
VVLHGAANRTAVKWFATQCRENRFKVPANPAAFLRFWHKHVGADGNIIRSADRAGRRSALTPLLVDQAYKGIMQWAQAGRSKPYESHAELEEECPAVQRVLGEAGVTISTLVKAIKAKHPKFGRKKLIIRHKLSDANKQQRVTMCTQLLARPTRDKHRVVFIDAKSITMVEKSLYGYVDLADSRAVEGIRPATHKSKPISVKYYAAVNAVLGPVLLTCYTGSSGLDNDHSGKDYKVRSGLEVHWGPLGLHMSHSQPELGQPSLAQRACLHALATNTQPQHTETLAHRRLRIQLVLVHPGLHVAVRIIVHAH